MRETPGPLVADELIKSFRKTLAAGVCPWCGTVENLEILGAAAWTERSVGGRTRRTPGGRVTGGVLSGQEWGPAPRAACSLAGGGWTVADRVFTPVSGGCGPLPYHALASAPAVQQPRGGRAGPGPGPSGAQAPAQGLHDGVRAGHPLLLPAHRAHRHRLLPRGRRAGRGCPGAASQPAVSRSPVFPPHSPPRRLAELGDQCPVVWGPGPLLCRLCPLPLKIRSGRFH